MGAPTKRLQSMTEGLRLTVVAVARLALATTRVLRQGREKDAVVVCGRRLEAVAADIVDE